MKPPPGQENWPYIFRGLGARKGQRCRISKLGGRLYIAVEFTDGHKFMASPNSVRRAPT